MFEHCTVHLHRNATLCMVWFGIDGGLDGIWRTTRVEETIIEGSQPLISTETFILKTHVGVLAFVHRRSKWKATLPSQPSIPNFTSGRLVCFSSFNLISTELLEPSRSASNDIGLLCAKMTRASSTS